MIFRFPLFKILSLPLRQEIILNLFLFLDCLFAFINRPLFFSVRLFLSSFFSFLPFCFFSYNYFSFFLNIFSFFFKLFFLSFLNYRSFFFNFFGLRTHRVETLVPEVKQLRGWSLPTCVTPWEYLLQ